MPMLRLLFKLPDQVCKALAVIGQRILSEKHHDVGLAQSPANIARRAVIKLIPSQQGRP